MQAGNECYLTSTKNRKRSICLVKQVAATSTEQSTPCMPTRQTQTSHVGVKRKLDFGTEESVVS